MHSTQIDVKYRGDAFVNEGSGVLALIYMDVKFYTVMMLSESLKQLWSAAALMDPAVLSLRVFNVHLETFSQNWIIIYNRLIYYNAIMICDFNSNITNDANDGPV